MAKEYVYVKLTKEWGGFREGEVIRFGYSKGERIIAEGKGIEVPKQDAVNAPLKKSPKVETAMKVPKAETAEVTPQIKEFEKPKQSRRGRKRKEE